MKQALLILFLGIFTITNAQNRESQVVDELIAVTKVKESLPLMVNSIIDRFKQKSTNIPDTYWEEIKNSIDYFTFLEKVKKLYIENYNLAELKELVSLYKSGNIESYKLKLEKITPQLYQIGKEFGQQTAQFIVEKIKAYKK